MPVWIKFFIIALGGALFLEGALYTLFPDGMKRAMAELQNMSASSLRTIGLALAVIGMIIVMLMLPNL
jgi:uncharacterized protein YjeT (DUF2065 family)